MLDPSELKAIADKAQTYAKFMRATGYDIHATRALNEKHALGLVPMRPSGAKPEPGRPCPKPKGKGKGGADA